MLKNFYLLAKIGADTAENEQHFAEILPTDALWRLRRAFRMPFGCDGRRVEPRRHTHLLRGSLRVDRLLLGPIFSSLLGLGDSRCRYCSNARVAMPAGTAILDRSTQDRENR